MICEQEERVSTPVVPAELDFGDDDEASAPEAGTDPAGWGQCYNCEAPVRAFSFGQRLAESTVCRSARD